MRRNKSVGITYCNCKKNSSLVQNPILTRSWTKIPFKTCTPQGRVFFIKAIFCEAFRFSLFLLFTILGTLTEYKTYGGTTHHSLWVASIYAAKNWLHVCRSHHSMMMIHSLRWWIWMDYYPEVVYDLHNALTHKRPHWLGINQVVHRQTPNTTKE